MPGNGTPEGRDNALERELMELGRDLDYPPTPDLAAAIRQRLDRERQTPPRRALPSWALAAAVLAVFVVVPFLSYSLFDGSLGGNGSSGAGGGQVAGSSGDAAPESAEGGRGAEEAPTSAGTGDDARESVGPDSDQPSSATGPVRAWGERLGLGEPISLETAEARVGGLLLPAAAGSPDRAYAVAGPTGDGVALIYGTREDFERARPDTGFVLTQAPGGIEEAFGAGGGAGAEGVVVGGEPGVWVPGPGDPSVEGYRLTEGLGGSALFFVRGDAVLRLESNLTRDEAIRLAESVR
jgi:hypothetical protein